VVLIEAFYTIEVKADNLDVGREERRRHNLRSQAEGGWGGKATMCVETRFMLIPKTPLHTGAGLLLGAWQQETRKVKLQEVRVEIKVREESESQSKIKSQKISRSPEDKAN
jgi:hypothetical protein